MSIFEKCSDEVFWSDKKRVIELYEKAEYLWNDYKSNTGRLKLAERYIASSRHT